MEQLQREVQSLTDKLSALKVSKKKAPQQQVQGASQAGLVKVGGASKRNRRRKRRAKAAAQTLGQITLNRMELIRSVKVESSKETADYIDLVPSNLVFLKQFSMFDRIKWNRASVVYKPAVGATFGGMVSYGVLWGFDKSPKTRGEIAALTPNQSHALWYDGGSTPMVLPTAKLQTRPWFTPDDADSVEKGPGRLCYVSSTSETGKTAGTEVGELWLDYSVTMTGTTF